MNQLETVSSLDKTTKYALCSVLGTAFNPCVGNQVTIKSKPRKFFHYFLSEMAYRFEIETKHVQFAKKVIRVQQFFRRCKQCTVSRCLST